MIIVKVMIIKLLDIFRIRDIWYDYGFFLLFNKFLFFIYFNILLNIFNFKLNIFRVAIVFLNNMVLFIIIVIGRYWWVKLWCNLVKGLFCFLSICLIYSCWSVNGFLI